MMTKGRFETLQLRPIVLDYGQPGNTRGGPSFASKRTGETILKHVADLSSAFNTRFEIKDGAANIRVS